MTIAATTQVPLVADQDGTLRFTGSRVTLDVVLKAFHDGASAEEIAEDFPGLKLADVYAAIAHYLRHREATDAYLQKRAQTAQALRQRVPDRRRAGSLRRRLLSRRAVAA